MRKPASMLSTKSYLRLYAVLLVVSAMLGIITREGDGKEMLLRDVSVRQEYTAQPQARSERAWRAISGERIWVIGDEESEILYQPALLKADKRGNLYLVDYGDFKVKMYSPDGAMLRTFGTGRGKGPGELLNPTDFSVTETGELWVLDDRNARITVYRADGSIHTHVPVLGLPSRIALLGNGTRFVLCPSPSRRENLFELFSKNGQSVRTFGKFIADQAKYSIALDGWVIESKPSEVVYAFMRAGYIVSFDSTGRLRYYRETIDQVPFPQVRESGRSVSLLPDAPLSALSINIEGEELYLLSHIASFAAKVGVIDVYSSHDGSYLYSFKLPEWATFVHVGKEFIYSLGDTTLTKWKR